MSYLGGRFTASVYTTAPLETHQAFSSARSNFKGQSGLDFFQDMDPVKLSYNQEQISKYPKQIVDLYSAFSWIEGKVSVNDTRYVGIMEDDFEWCPDSWDELKAVIYEVASRDQLEKGGPLCGIFVATGGSGLVVRTHILRLLRQALTQYGTKMKPDVLIQDCLAGDLELCSSCKLAASRRMILRHTGATESTYENRTYPEDRWQCGWRQPFNGRLGIWVP
ncbi:hypothetical protein M422DRAFT_51551 [Sphaerobolus stellatus SS14]|uniref:Glycosyltransferase family 25 protein n=1 Tax=Sphaerobolus stellatus (strain SS14) TaxID=990650 RepID=A0A0C9VD06_SPHS4|nr:hypothetical protein M422DRAFT_51551 [Sphaerobolus stellatus SS14]